MIWKIRAILKGQSVLEAKCAFAMRFLGRFAQFQIRPRHSAVKPSFFSLPKWRFSAPQARNGRLKNFEPAAHRKITKSDGGSVSNFGIVGAAYVAARFTGAREKQNGGDGPAPTKFAATR